MKAGARGKAKLKFWREYYERSMKDVEDYRERMKSEFERRQKEQPSYTLRQYARDLELTPMHLSLVLRRERGLSREKAIVVAGRIGLKGKEQRRFVLQAMAKSARARFRKNLALYGLKNLCRKITAPARPGPRS